MGEKRQRQNKSRVSWSSMIKNALMHCGLLPMCGNTRWHNPLQQTLSTIIQASQSKREEKKSYLLMLMIVAALMCLELVDPAVPLLAKLAVERLAGFAGGLCLYTPSETATFFAQDRQYGGNNIASR